MIFRNSHKIISLSIDNWDTLQIIVHLIMPIPSLLMKLLIGNFDIHSNKL